MKRYFLLNRAVLSTLFLFFAGSVALAQVTNRVMPFFPAGTKLYANIPYANDTLKKHLLDIYMPADAKGDIPLVIWVHGGAWMLNDKYADMSYMKKTISAILNNGFALASIDYRYSTQAIFPAQIQDCNQAVEYLYQHASKYGYNRNKIALIGFSAGGHLASLLALSHNNKVGAFLSPSGKTSFHITSVVDFYGPADFLATLKPEDENAPKSSVSILLGASPLERPDLAKFASPATYIDKNDPPFLIIQGEKDESVPAAQSKLLSSWLTLAKVQNELIIVKNAPHYGEMFDETAIREKVITFLKTTLTKP